MIVDAHNDLLLELAFRAEETRPFATHWLPKLRAGGVGVQVCPIFVELEDLPELGLRRALAQVQAFHRAARECPDDVTVVRSAADLDSLDGRIGLVLSLEGVEPLGYDPGSPTSSGGSALRMVSLTWNHRNPFADGLGEIADDGLTGPGRELVASARRARRHARPLARVAAHVRRRARGGARGDGAREPRLLPRRPTHRATSRTSSCARWPRAAASSACSRIPFVARRADRRARSSTMSTTRPGRRRSSTSASGGDFTAAARALGARPRCARRLLPPGMPLDASDRGARGAGGLPVRSSRPLERPRLRGRPARRGPRRELAPHLQAGRFRLKVAVVGGGVIGLACAWYLRNVVRR